MKETPITKMIPTIHKYVLFTLVSTFLLFFFTFITLVEGLYIERLTLMGVKIEKLYLKWDNALLIQIDKIDLTHLQTDQTTTTLEPLREVPRIVHHLNRWVNSIQIKNLRYKTLNGKISYIKNSIGTLSLRDHNLTCDAHFIFHNDLFYFDAPSCKIKETNIRLSLTVPLNDQRLYADVEFDIPDTPTLFLSAKGDNDSLAFSLKTEKVLSSVVPIVDFFGVDPITRPWIAEYADGSSINIESLYGNFHYDKPDELLYSLKAEATVMNGKYTFAQGFEPIKASQVKLHFHHGKLHIVPINGYFYNLPTEKSYLIIDFTRSPNMIDIFLSTKNAILNDPILNLLQNYDIEVPIKQTSGKCAVDLNISVNLHTFETKAHGSFMPTPSKFLLHNFPFSTENGQVFLDNTHIMFKDFTAHYDKNKINAKIDGFFEASTRNGNVNIQGYDISPFGDNANLSLWNSATPLSVKYNISPKGDQLIILPSLWNLNGKKLQLDGLKTPFDFEHATGKIPSVEFSYDNRIKGSFDGYIDINQKNNYFNFALKTINLNNIILSNYTLQGILRLKNDSLVFTAKNSTQWRFEDTPLLLSPFTIKYDTNTINIESFEFIISDLLKGKLEGKYLTDQKIGQAKIHTIQPIDSDLRKWIDPNIPVQFDIDGSKRDLIFESDRLNASLVYQSDGWKLTLNDLSRIAKFSPKLRQYHLDNGKIDLWYSAKRSNYAFQGILHSPYSLLFINDQPIHDYSFNGTYNDGESHIRVNNKIRIISNRDKIRVQGEYIGLNAPQLSKLLDKNIESNIDKSTSNPIPWMIELSDSYVYLMENRKIMADSLEAFYKDQIFNAVLKHSDGKASLKLKNGLYSIEGEKFNDEFMKNLFNMKDFSGGEFSFQIQGSDEHLKGVLRVENTILKNYKLLNNVLAFINTVPSLTTFSLPNYNSKGLPVKEGYAYFTYIDNVVNVENFTLNSPEIKLIGSGKGNLNNQSLNGLLTLKTDIGSAIGKVPVVGYILFGNDGSVSTTLTLSGKLDNPKIETSITKEIVSTPFNILKRTFNYPFSWMKSETDKPKKINEQNSVSGE